MNPTSERLHRPDPSPPPSSRASARRRRKHPSAGGLAGVLGLGLLAIVLSACTISVVPGNTTVRARIGITITLNDVIAEFAPTRDEGASYRINEPIAFRIRVREAGWISLTALDPDGAVYTFARNIYVDPGLNVIRGPSPSLRFVTTGPYGRHYVRAAFTSSPTRGTVVYDDRTGFDPWNRAIEAEISTSNVRDVAQTYYWID